MSDIKACHDAVPWGFTLLGFRNRHIPQPVAAAFFRAHRCPEVQLSVGGKFATVSCRSRGALTGSPTAGPMARIAIEDSLILSLPEFEGVFDIDPSHQFPAIAWSDNICTVGSSLEAAIRNFQIWSKHLLHVANMLIKPDSKVAVVSTCRHFAERHVVIGGESWVVRDEEKTLGCVVSGSGDDSSARTLICNAWNRCFWANAKALCNSSALAPRFRFWRMLSYSSVDHALAGLRPTIASASSLVRYHNRICIRIAQVRRDSGDDIAEFVVRRNKFVAEQKSLARIDISLRFAYKCVTWVDHLARHLESVQSQLLECQGDSWLRDQRQLMNSQSLFAGATGTRAQAGFPKRWGERWVDFLGDAGGWDNPSKSKRISTERAQILRAHFMKPASAEAPALLDVAGDA